MCAGGGAADDAGDGQVGGVHPAACSLGGHHSRRQ